MKLGGARAGAAAERARAVGQAGAVAARAKANCHASDLARTIAEIRITGLSAVAQELNARGVRTARRGTWTATTTGRLLARLDAAPAS